jgi:hypothetical protein
MIRFRTSSRGRKIVSSRGLNCFVGLVGPGIADDGGKDSPVGFALNAGTGTGMLRSNPDDEGENAGTDLAECDSELEQARAKQHNGGCG